MENQWERGAADCPGKLFPICDSQNRKEKNSLQYLKLIEHSGPKY